MTKAELNKFKSILEAKQAELVQFVRNREGIAIEKSPDALDEVQHAAERELAIRNLPWTAYCIQCQELADRNRASGDAEAFDDMLVNAA
jgi:DnaK suppressor protein